MIRLSRPILSQTGEGFYHIRSAIAMSTFIFNEPEMVFFQDSLKELSKSYVVDIIAYTILSNHYHLILRMKPAADVSDEEINDRVHRYYQHRTVSVKAKLTAEDSEAYRQRFGSISKFIQDLNQTFSRWYNKKHENIGRIWGKRYKSTLIQGGKALLACCVYIDLNCLRAGIVDRPELYPYGSLYSYNQITMTNPWLTFQPLKQAISLYSGKEFSQDSQVLQEYIHLLHRQMPPMPYGTADDGGKPSSIKHKPSDTDYPFLKRIRYFRDGVFLGDQDFVSRMFLEFRSYFKTDRIRQGYLMIPKRNANPDDLLYLYSMRKLGVPAIKNPTKREDEQ